MPWIILGGLLLVAAALMVFVFFVRGRRRLSASATARIRSLMEKADRASDPVLRIMEYDKVLDQLLLELGFHGTTGEKLKKGGARFSNTQALWKCHKLRNIVAHEHGAAASTSDADFFKRVLAHAFLQVSSKS